MGDLEKKIVNKGIWTCKVMLEIECLKFICVIDTEGLQSHVYLKFSSCLCFVDFLLISMPMASLDHNYKSHFSNSLFGYGWYTCPSTGTSTNFK